MYKKLQIVWQAANSDRALTQARLSDLMRELQNDEYYERIAVVLASKLKITDDLIPDIASIIKAEMLK